MLAMHQSKPYASSSDENKQAILEKIGIVFNKTKKILEIGSGTGQHAVHFGKYITNASWQTSDTAQHHHGIIQWLDEAGLGNVLPPIELDVSKTDWDKLDSTDGVFSANTVHIMHWRNVQDMFSGIGKVLEAGGTFCLYGPFNYAGKFSSQSNADFDLWLKKRDPHSGIRDIDDLKKLAEKAGFYLQEDLEMPVNNRLLVWRKTG